MKFLACYKFVCWKSKWDFKKIAVGTNVGEAASATVWVWCALVWVRCFLVSDECLSDLVKWLCICMSHFFLSLHKNSSPTKPHPLTCLATSYQLVESQSTYLNKWKCSILSLPIKEDALFFPLRHIVSFLTLFGLDVLTWVPKVSS